MLLVVILACQLLPAGVIKQKRLRMTLHVMVRPHEDSVAIERYDFYFPQQMPPSCVRKDQCLLYVLEEEMTLHSWAVFRMLSSVT